MVASSIRAEAFHYYPLRVDQARALHRGLVLPVKRALPIGRGADLQCRRRVGAGGLGWGLSASLPVISNEELIDLLALGHEQRGIEFKGPGDATDKAFRAKVIRASLAMANRRDGGYAVIGIDDKDPAAGGPGLTTQQITQWTNYDDLATWFGEYADPAFTFEVAARQPRQGVDVVVIQVHEFDDIPVLCKRDYGTILSRGALYTRSHARPETSDAYHHSELRELLDLAIEKGLRRFVEQTHRAGLQITPAPDGPYDVEQFSAQLGDLE